MAFNAAFFLATIVVAFLFQNSAAVTYTVGDAQGWVIPASAADYTTWAASKSFKVGDILQFDFSTGSHDVTGVSKADFDSCSNANPLFTISSGPASVTLNSTGEKHYICGVIGHCSAGQKLSITVSAATAAPTPAPASPAPPPASTIAPSPVATTPTASPSPAVSPPTASPSPSPSTSSSPTPSASDSPSPSVATSPPPSISTSPAPDTDTASPPSPGNSATSLGFSSATLLILAAAVLF